MEFPLFDTHAHLISDDWERYPPLAVKPGLPTRRTDYTVTAEALVALMDEHDVPTALAVQRLHVYGYDNSYILDSWRRFPSRLLPVVMLDTRHPDTPARYAEMVRNNGARGFRMANTRPAHLDPGWINSDAALRVWRTCAELATPVSVIIFHNQLAYTLPLLHGIARQFPQLPILVDHLGTAYGRTKVELAWAKESGIAETALPPPPDFGIAETIGIFDDTPNVYFKLTEVNLDNLCDTGASPTGLVRRLADRFGAQRLVWGSDVGQSLRWSFAQKASMAREAGSLLSTEERRLFLHDNAARAYSAREGAALAR
jgi:predicted TIM-barrel fold metal-dependent hydrolase